MTKDLDIFLSRYTALACAYPTLYYKTNSKIHILSVFTFFADMETYRRNQQCMTNVDIICGVSMASGVSHGFNGMMSLNKENINSSVNGMIGNVGLRAEFTKNLKKHFITVLLKIQFQILQDLQTCIRFSHVVVMKWAVFTMPPLWS
jgi:hypothetical protein